MWCPSGKDRGSHSAGVETARAGRKVGNRPCGPQGPYQDSDLFSRSNVEPRKR